MWVDDNRVNDGYRSLYTYMMLLPESPVFELWIGTKFEIWYIQAHIVKYFIGILYFSIQELLQTLLHYELFCISPCVFAGQTQAQRQHEEIALPRSGIPSPPRPPPSSPVIAAASQSLSLHLHERPDKHVFD